MINEQNLSYYINEGKKIITNDNFQTIRIALLSSFTINGLEQVIRVKCNENKINCITYVAPYDQYSQEILNENSTLFKFKPDITFLILDTRTIFKDIFHFPYTLPPKERTQFVTNKLDEILNLVKFFSKNYDSKLIISNLNVPTYSPFGIYETKTEFGIKEMVYEFNKILSSKLRKESAVYIYDLNSFISKYGELNTFDYHQFFSGDIRISFQYIPYLGNELMGFIKPILGKNKKCIVLDLDNTLWGGVVGEDGFDGIKLGLTPPGNSYYEFQRNLLSLSQRGIILAINSKNNWDEAINVIKNHPYMILREQNFASMRINWNDKISNMKEIAKELNIGLDSMVFLDDDPHNRELVRRILPEVYTPHLPPDPSFYASMLQGLNDFNVLSITDEDLKRGEAYFHQRQRQEAIKNIENLDDFLKELQTKITIKKIDSFTIPRVSQLTLKTNQFNLTTRRYQEEDIKKFSEDQNFLIGCAQVEDKFGDNGITGVFIVKKENADEWLVDTFLLSCRVMGRKIEEAIMMYIFNEAKKLNVSHIKAEFIPTEKNIPSKDFLPNLGFMNEGKYWICDINKNFKIPSYITIKVE